MFEDDLGACVFEHIDEATVIMVKKFGPCSELNVAYKSGMIKDDDMTRGGSEFDVEAGNLIFARSYGKPKVARMILQSKSINNQKKIHLVSQLVYTSHTLRAEKNGVPPMKFSEFLKNQDENTDNWY